MMDDERDVMQVELIPGLPWVVGYPPSPCPLPRGEGSEAVRQGEGSEAVEAAEGGADRVGWVFVGLVAAWCVVTAVLFIAGALTPLAGNGLAMVWIAAGLVLAALMAVTCPRPSEDDDGEVFWTLGREPAVVGQCTPSRVTLTGGER